MSSPVGSCCCGGRVLPVEHPFSLRLEARQVDHRHDCIATLGRCFLKSCRLPDQEEFWSRPPIRRLLPFDAVKRLFFMLSVYSQYLTLSNFLERGMVQGKQVAAVRYEKVEDKREWSGDSRDCPQHESFLHEAGRRRASPYTMICVQGSREASPYNDTRYQLPSASSRRSPSSGEMWPSAIIRRMASRSCSGFTGGSGAASVGGCSTGSF